MKKVGERQKYRVCGLLSRNWNLHFSWNRKLPFAKRPLTYHYDSDPLHMSSMRFKAIVIFSYRDACHQICIMWLSCYIVNLHTESLWKQACFFSEIFGFQAVIPIVLLFSHEMFSQLYLITTSRKKWKITQEVYTFCIFHDKFVETENNSVIAYRNHMVLISPLIFFQVKIILYNKWDVTKTGNGERGTGKGGLGTSLQW